MKHGAFILCSKVCYVMARKSLDTDSLNGIKYDVA